MILEGTSKKKKTETGTTQKLSNFKYGSERKKKSEKIGFCVSPKLKYCLS